MGNCGRFVKGLRIPTGRRQTSWLFTSALEDLNAELPSTNPVSGQSHNVIDSTVAQSTLALRTLRYHGHLDKTDSGKFPSENKLQTFD